MNTRAANRYAKALIDVANESQSAHAVYNDMHDISQSIVHSIELQHLLNSPVVKISDKINVVRAIFGNKVHQTTDKLFHLLAQNNRLELLFPITQQYTHLFNQQKGIVNATVITALELDDTMRTKVMKKAKEIVGDKNISLESKVNPDIVGGFILRIGDKQLDASVSTQLKNVKRSLIA